MRIYVLSLMVLASLVALTFSRPIQADQTASSADDPAVKAKIEPSLLADMARSESVDFFVEMTESADLSPAEELSTKLEKGTFVYNALRETAERTQAPLRAQLDQMGIEYKPYFIVNKILVRNGNKPLVFTMAARQDVAKITANHKFQLPQPFKLDKTRSADGIEPNLTFVKADQVWDTLGVTGEGTVLAGNDTGLDWTHSAIQSHYRGWDGTTADHNYSWWDATSNRNQTEPYDDNSHGTHTTGTMVGDDGGENRIGIAPGAKTIHCKNMDAFGGGEESWFIECFEWDLAPWDLNRENPRPDMAPDAINNSWGFPGGTEAFKEPVRALQAAGIVVEASAGNEGPSCGTLGSPGDYPTTLTTGSVNHQAEFPGTLTEFSSRGPSMLAPDTYFPSVMAPGEDIRSAMPGGSYESMSGTSMSGPHVAGLVGLLWSANPALRGMVAETQELIQMTAVPLTGETGSNCGGDYEEGPNNDWGHGTIDALAATSAAQLFGDPGYLAGVVTEAGTGSPVEKASVRIQSSNSFGWKRLTNTDGFYRTPVFSGTYTVTTDVYGYYITTVPSVTVTSFETTTLNIELQTAPSYTFQGIVTDKETGWPLYAQVSVAGYPGKPVWTDPLTGAYSISLAAGRPYSLVIKPWSSGYSSFSSPIEPLTGDVSLPVTLVADRASCNAPGYKGEFVYSEQFENSDGGFVSEGTNSSWQYGVPTSGPRGAHSGEMLWATNLSGNYNNDEMSTLTSPDIDLSAYAGKTPILTWWEWGNFESGYDYAEVYVSNDGGQNWVSYGRNSVPREWSMATVQLDPSYAVANFRIQFRLTTDSSVTYDGWYIDDIGIAMAEVLERPEFYSADFEADDGGLTVEGVNPSWQLGTPTRGPGMANSGVRAWATGLDTVYNNDEASYLVSPIIDTSSAEADGVLTISWYQWLQTEPTYDTAALEVSNDGGQTWSALYGPTSGSMDSYWYQYTMWLDTTLYSTPNFRFRFSLTTDSAIAYLGYYIDDILVSAGDPYQAPTLPCKVGTGSLVAGQVLDANTQEPINGAKVRHSDDGSTVFSIETPNDDQLGDGFYMLYSPLGDHSLKGNKRGYAEVTTPINVVSNTVATQDILLPTGQLVAEPEALNVTLNKGEKTTLTFNVANQGGVSADFSLKERLRNFVPARKTGAPLMRIPIDYKWGANPVVANTTRSATAPQQSADEPWLDVASYPMIVHSVASAEHNGLIYAAGGADGMVAYDQLMIYDPSADSWTEGAPMNTARYDASAAFIDGLFYVVGGVDNSYTLLSSVEIYDPATNSWTEGTPLPVALSGASGVVVGDQLYLIGGCFDSSCWPPTSAVYHYDASSQSWSETTPYPIAAAWLSCGNIDEMIYCAGGADGISQFSETYRFDPATESWDQLSDMPESLYGSSYVAANGMLLVNGGIANNFSEVTNATYIYDPIADSWTQDANSNNASYLSGSACGFYKIGGFDLNSVLDTVENYPGWDSCGKSPDITWLDVMTETVSLSAGNTQTLEVTIDTNVPEITQPGTYYAEIRLGETTPYTVPAISVVLTVRPQAGFGRVSVDVNGLKPCDVNPQPIKASVQLQDLLLKTNTSGELIYWTPQGSYTVTVSQNGYLSRTETITITNGLSTTHSIDLRPISPCATLTPDNIDHTVPVGANYVDTISLDNRGAGQLDYLVLESPLTLTQVTVPELPIYVKPTDTDTDTVVTGPLSAKSSSLSSGLDGTTERAPTGNWFGGEDLPGVLARYASAQCDEQPNFFYLFAGMNGFEYNLKSFRYDVSQNEWSELTPIPVRLEGAVATCYQGRIYISGGISNDAKGDQLFVYDIAQDKWFVGASLPYPVWGAATASLNGKVYLFGGDNNFNPGTPYSSTIVYDIAANSWATNTITMPIPASSMGFAQVDSQLYLVGGWGENSAENINITQTFRYDLVANTWTVGPEFTSARADLSLVATDQALYAIGGDEDGGMFFDASKKVERLDLDKFDQWVSAESLPAATTGVNANFCTTGGLFPTQIWSLGGVSFNGATASNRFLSLTNGESCPSIYSDVKWLSSEVVSSTLAADSEAGLKLHQMPTADMIGDTHHATVVVMSNDPIHPYWTIPVTIRVDQARIFLPIIRR